MLFLIHPSTIGGGHFSFGSSFRPSVRLSVCPLSVAAT